MAGFCIGMGAMAYLRAGAVVGPFLFAIGLLAVCYFQLPLYTGRVQFFSWRTALDYLWMLVGNIIGVLIVVMLAEGMSFQVDPAGIVDARLSAPWWLVGLRAIPCGFIMTLAVRAAKEKHYLPLLFGIPTFIICGFPHCVADIFYYGAVRPALADIALVYLATVVGNALGCNAYRLFIPSPKKSPVPEESIAR